MKLMNILENDYEQRLVHSYERITNLLNDFKRGKGQFDHTINEPEGVYEINFGYREYPFPGQDGKWGKIELRIYYIPNMETPIIPLDVLSKSVTSAMNIMRKEVPALLEEHIDDLNMIDLKIFELYVRAGRSLFPSMDLFGIITTNVKIRGYLQGLGNVLLDPSNTEELKLTTGEVPEFAKDYKTVHDHIINKTAKILKAYRYGKWKGHTYDLGTLDGKYNTILLINNYTDTIEGGVIHPAFKIHLTLIRPEVDGIPPYSSDYPFTKEETKELMDHLAKVFIKYGIKID
jgi:hypothetical protein